MAMTHTATAPRARGGFAFVSLMGSDGVGSWRPPLTCAPADRDVSATDETLDRRTRRSRRSMRARTTPRGYKEDTDEKEDNL